MDFRPATDADIDKIVALLRRALGEQLLPKSSDYWRWKHMDSPFGQSPVLLAFEGDRLIGVRAFMKWQWIRQGQMICALRAVDTATDPEFQGRGVFSKLTLALKDSALRSGENFVFNTPNAKSRPGYLKMGWKDAGRLPIRMKLSLQALALSALNRLPPYQIAFPDSIETCLNDPGLTELLPDGKAKELGTKFSIEYLRWRYLQVPNLQYFACRVIDKGKLLAVGFYRIKESKWGRELRIADVFASESGIALLRTAIFARAKAVKASVVTISSAGALVTGIGFLTIPGPRVTVCPLNMKVDELLGFHNWCPSLGDLELF